MIAKPDDWKDDIQKAAIARWEAEAAQEAELRKQEGKISIWLGRAEDDAPTFTHEHQAVLRSVVDALRAEGIELDAPFMTVDSVDAVCGYTGQVIIAAAVIGAPVMKAALVAWIKERAKRKIVVEYHPNGQIKKVEAQTEKQVLEIIEAARKAELPAPKKKNK